MLVFCGKFAKCKCDICFALFCRDVVASPAICWLPTLRRKRRGRCAAIGEKSVELMNKLHIGVLHFGLNIWLR